MPPMPAPTFIKCCAVKSTSLSTNNAYNGLHM
jgi:hypothetical protein